MSTGTLLGSCMDRSGVGCSLVIKRSKVLSRTQEKEKDPGIQLLNDESWWWRNQTIWYTPTKKYVVLKVLEERNLMRIMSQVKENIFMVFKQ